MYKQQQKMCVLSSSLEFIGFALAVMAFTSILGASDAVAQAGSNRIGGDAGTQFNQTCPRDTYAVGIMYWDDGNIIHQLQLVCAEVDPRTGRAIGETRQNSPQSPQTRPGGSRWLHRGEQFCPSGSFIASDMAGYTGQFFNWRAVSGLEFKCIQFSNVDVDAGTSDIRRASSREQVGARFSGRRYLTNGRIRHGSGAIVGDMALNGLTLKTGGVLDSVVARAKIMPWVRRESPLNVPPLIPRVSSGISSPPTSGTSSATQQPDLFIGPQISLYRVDKFGRVPDEFCNQSTVQASLLLPSRVKYTVFNAGAVRSPQSSVRVRFGNRTTIQSVPSLEPGAREDIFFDRGTVRRCLSKIGGRCTECLKQQRYNDPSLELFVDPNNIIDELSEVNNRLRR